MGWTNRQALLTIHTKLRGMEGNFEEWAEKMSSELKYIVLERLDNGEFLGGSWQNKPYSTNVIKAHKLGWVNVKDDTMSIAGIAIDDEDWYWGGYDRNGNFRWSDGRKVPLESVNPAVESPRGGMSARPAPVFIPGYRGWRMKYLGKSNQYPDLNLTGGLRNSFGTSVERGVGSNQYQTRVRVSFEVDSAFVDIANITNYYRRWIDVTEEELAEAIKEVGGFYV